MEELGRNFVVVELGTLWNFMIGGLRNLSKMLLFAHSGGLGIFFFQNGEIRNFLVVGLGILWWWD